MPVPRTNFQIHTGVFAVAFAFLLLLFAPLTRASAADIDSLRIGGDYKFMTLRKGASFKECRRACKNDVSCRAWTFVKQRVRNTDGINLNLGPDLTIGLGGRKEIVPPQCRLKHSVGEKLDNDCCISGVKRVVERRRPSKAERCADYAEKAIEQQDKNLAQRCRYRGNRWHGNYRTHYRWCMNNSRRVSDRETAVRGEKLRECRIDGRVRNRRCDRYASTAMDILKQARENDCRSSNSGWENEHERVYEWCLDNGPAKRADLLERAQAKLAACIRRGGGALIERCETYADNALAQVRKARKNRCGYRGELWRNDFRTHYRFCRKNNHRSVRRASRRREASLDRCTRRSDEARVMETGSVGVRQRNKQQWHSVRFNKRFRDPVVIMGPVSANGSDPAHARVRAVTSRGFEFRIEEFGKDGVHIRENLSYMVVEKGIHKFDGMVIEAGTRATNAVLVNRRLAPVMANPQWATVRLSNKWRSAPVVLVQTQTFNGSDPVNARIRSVSRRGFDVTLSEQEADLRGHVRETIAYVAITQGRHQIESGRDANAPLWSGRVLHTNHKWRKIAFPRRIGNSSPALFATAQSSNGADTFDIRYRLLSQHRVQMRLQEEQSRDRETNHTNEMLGVVVLPYGDYWATSSRSVDDQASDGGSVPPVVPDVDLASCRDYADRSVSQFRRSRRLACGFSGSNWHGNAGRHRRWCRRNGLAAAERVLTRKRDRLEQCRDRAGAGSTDQWVSLGCAKASFKKDTDAITVDRTKGPFRAVRLQTSRAKVKIYRAQVTFGNGSSQVLSFSGGLSKGAATQPLDLKGNRRFISRITLNYKSIFKFPPKEGQVCVYGKK
jgi:hypothetical protein